MNNIDQPNFDPGGIIDREDRRDYQWEEVGGAPPPFNWSVGFDIEAKLGLKLTVKDQNGSYSCGGQSWAYLAEVLEAVATGTYEPRSAKYMYSQTYVPGGGSRGRDNADIFVTQGVCRESVLKSYQNGLPPNEGFMQRSIDITDFARKDAQLSKASAYAQVPVNIEDMANATAMNNGCVVGIVGANNGTWNSKFPQPPRLGDKIWRHWVYAGKVIRIDGKKYIGILNSWGKFTGDQGWQYISEDYIKTRLTISSSGIVTKVGSGGSTIFSVWTHVFGPNPIVVFKHTFSKNINFSETGAEVKALQDALRIEGSFPKTVNSTGVYGDITRRAVLDFQFKYKVAPQAELISLNGKVVGAKTRAKLNELFS